MLVCQAVKFLSVKCSSGFNLECKHVFLSTKGKVFSRKYTLREIVLT